MALVYYLVGWLVSHTLCSPKRSNPVVEWFLVRCSSSSADVALLARRHREDNNIKPSNRLRMDGWISFIIISGFEELLEGGECSSCLHGCPHPPKKTQPNKVCR